MSSDTGIPTRLRTVACFYFLVGVVGLASFFGQLLPFHFLPLAYGLGIIGIPVALGLLNRQEFWRRRAVLLPWLFLLAGLLLVFGLAVGGGPQALVLLFDFLVPSWMSISFLASTMVLLFLLALWAGRILKQPAVRGLFVVENTPTIDTRTTRKRKVINAIGVLSAAAFLYVIIQPIFLLYAAESPVTITGRVTDMEGNPIPGAGVGPIDTCFGMDKASRTFDGVACDANGSYRIHGIQQWFLPRVDLVASAKGYCVSTVHLPEEVVRNVSIAGAIWETLPIPFRLQTPEVSPVPTRHGNVIEGVHFRLERAASLSGRIVNRAGQALIGQSVLMVSETEPKPERAWPRNAYVPFGGEGIVWLCSDDEGQFSQDHIPPGTYTFRRGLDDAVWDDVAYNKPLTLEGGDEVVGYDIVIGNWQPDLPREDG